MNSAITLTRIVLALLIVFNFMVLITAKTLTHYGIVAFGFAVLFVIWWLTSQVKSKAKLKDYLPKIWVILGSFFVGIGLFCLILIFTGGANGSTALFMSVVLAGLLLIRIGFNPDKT